MRVPVLFVLATIAAYLTARADVLPHLSAHGEWVQKR